jgi:GNAT superfamily N-acetyltransferase
MEPLGYEDFQALVTACTRAVHLEMKDTYTIASEDEPFDRWLRGEPDDHAWLRDWLRLVAQVHTVVLERYRSRGIGQALVMAARQHAAARHITP